MICQDIRIKIEFMQNSLRLLEVGAHLRSSANS